MTDRPRVLLLTNWLAVGGAETQLVRLAQHLRGHGYPVMVATIRPEGRGRAELVEAGIPHEVLPMRSPVSAITVLAGAVRLFRRWKPDVVVSFLFYANVLGRLAAVLARVPTVISSVRTPHFGGPISDAVLRRTDRLAMVTVANSTYTARRLMAARVVRENKLVVIPNGVPIDQFTDRHDRDATRRSLNVADADFMWLAVGRLEPVKDYPTLLQAVAMLRTRGMPAKLRIAADGSERGVLQRLVDDLRLSDLVTLLGMRLDVPDLMAAADAFVLSSMWEGLPNVVIEAMAARLPVVATDRGGTSELVEPLVTGLLVHPRDPHALAEAMSFVMRLPAAARLAMGDAARRTVAGRFALEGVMRLWEDLIGELTDRPSGVPARATLGAREREAVSG